MSWSTGEVADLAGVTVRTLHHYDDVGLLRPGTRTAAGYRRYDYSDLARLQRIVAYRELGLSLSEIAAVLDDPGVDPLHHLRIQRRRLMRRMHRLREMEGDQIERRLVSAHEFGAPPQSPDAMDARSSTASTSHGGSTTCTYEIHRGLGEMYVADSRFAAHYDARAAGLAAYLRDAIAGNADRAAA